MKSIGNVIKENYYINLDKLESDYNLVLEKNKTFQKLVTSLDLPKNYLMKYTTSLEESCKELDNCKKCKNLFECKNNWTITISALTLSHAAGNKMMCYNKDCIFVCLWLF